MGSSVLKEGPQSPRGSGSGQGMTRMWAKRPDLGLGSPPWDSPCVLSLCGKPRLPTREGRSGRCCLRRSLWGRWKSNSAGRQAGTARPNFPSTRGTRASLHCRALRPAGRASHHSRFPSRPTAAKRAPVRTESFPEPLTKKAGVTEACRASPSAEGQTQGTPTALPGPPQVPGCLAAGSREGCLCGHRRLPFSGSWAGLANGVLLEDGQGGCLFPARPAGLSCGRPSPGGQGSSPHTSLHLPQSEPRLQHALVAHLRPDSQWHPAHSCCSRTRSVTDIG